jgi:signal transduction histidine kinase
LQKFAFLISFFFSLNLQSQSWGIVLDWTPESISIENDSLKMIYHGKQYTFDGKQCLATKTNLKDLVCYFDVGALVPSHTLSYQSYKYYSINNKLYNSCKSPSLIKVFNSEIVGLLKNAEGKMIIATRENGFFINDQNQIKSLYLPGSVNLQNINTATYCNNLMIYNNGTNIYSLSSDDYVEKKIHTADTEDIHIASDKFNQLWVSDGRHIYKINSYQDLSKIEIELEGIGSSASEKILQFINIGSPQLFPDISYEYTLSNNIWHKLESNLLRIDSNPNQADISIRAFNNIGKSNVFNFNLSTVKSDSINTLMIYALASLGLLVLCLLLLLWRQLYLKKISDQNIKRLRAQRKLSKTNDKLFELQMNPHFIFNCLNAIKGLVATDKPKQARKAISDFASIMRSLLDYSREEQNTIEEEVRFLKKYLELQSLTYPDVFDFEITVDQSIDQSIHIPAMMIQPFVENAVLHGLIPKKEKGHLKIRFTDVNNYLTCRVKDTGIGINDHSTSQHLSQATKIINDRIRNSTIKTKLEILNMKDEKGDCIGTQVNIPLVVLK